MGNNSELSEIISVKDNNFSEILGFSEICVGFVCLPCSYSKLFISIEI